MRILLEALDSEISSYLTSEGLLQDISDIEDSLEICQRVQDLCSSEGLGTLDILPVSIYKVTGNDITLLSNNHYVIYFDGYYYDYYPQEFRNSFSGSLKVPVIQNRIKDKNLITMYDSNIKGYSIVEINR